VLLLIVMEPSTKLLKAPRECSFEARAEASRRVEQRGCAGQDVVANSLHLAAMEFPALAQPSLEAVGAEGQWRALT